MSAIPVSQSLSPIGESMSPNLRPSAQVGLRREFVLDPATAAQRAASQKRYFSDPIDVLWTDVEGEDSPSTDDALQACKRRSAGAPSAFGPVDRYVRTQANDLLESKGAFIDVRA
jgi:hypothetical protein